MYAFSIKKDFFPLVEITIDDSVIKEDIYIRELIKKCFEKVFQIIIKDNKELDLEEIDLEEDD